MPTRVLVVDDSPTIRKVVSAVLERHGFLATQAADGQTALEKLAESASGGGDLNGAGKIDLVLVDFVMPRMNGFQFCRAVRENERLRSTPVVLMSAKSDRIRDHFVKQTGAIDAITKPFDAQALIAVIENAIRRAEEWRQRDEIADEPPAGEPAVDEHAVDERAAAERAAAEADRARPAPESPRCALQGEMEAIPIGAVLQLLQIESKTGLLVVSDAKIEVTIAMRDGLIDLVQARGAGSEFRLGRYIVEHGLATPADIERILRDNSPTPRPPPLGPPTMPKEEPPTSGRRLLGDLLVDSGRVTRDQLREALARQSSELIYEVVRWPAGRFEFRLEPLPPLAIGARLGLPVASVVMEGFRRVDEWRVVEASLGSFDAVLLADPGAVDALGLDRLAKPEQKLLEMIDGERTVREIVAQSHMSSFDACKILFSLLEARLVRRRAA
jgi:DNA-binding response OmpR family regulator